VQRLHLVGFTSELDGLIFSAKDGARSGGYVVALDSELLDTIRDVLERRGRHRAPHAAPAFSPLRPTEGSALSPREIQARLRAGRRIDEVAMEAGVDDEWVRRFAVPVFAERAHVAGRAQAAVLELDGLGPSSESLGRAVAANLADRGQALTPGELADGWDAYQVRETAWMVEFHPPLHPPDDAARWGFDTRTARLTAMNGAASDLGWLGADGRGTGAAGPREEPAPAAGSNGATRPAPSPTAPPPAPAAERPRPAATGPSGAGPEPDDGAGQLTFDAAARTAPRRRPTTPGGAAGAKAERRPSGRARRAPPGQGGQAATGE
jgi:hypothetical protein